MTRGGGPAGYGLARGDRPGGPSGGADRAAPRDRDAPETPAPPALGDAADVPGPGAPGNRVTPVVSDPPGAAAPDLPRLARLLGGPDLAWLLDRVRRRLAREEALTGPVSLTDPSAAQRAAAERLLGRAPRGRTARSLTVRLDDVDATLRRSGAAPGGLAAAVVALTGPVAPLREVRERESHAWAAVYAPLAGLPHLADWADTIRGDGLVRRLCRTPEAAAPVVARAASVLRELPAEPPAPLPVFAARTLGDAHALDHGTPLATVILSGVRALTGFPDGSGAEWRREVWSSAGLLKDAVSSTVLTLSLRGTPALDWAAQIGEPTVLTLRQMLNMPPDAPRSTVYVCENPAVLSTAADTLGDACPPLVCLQGQPSAAALTLLRHLHAHGADFAYHGDFDWGGLRIATTLLRHIPWRPWRYTTADYLSAVTPARTSRPLTGLPTPSPWDPALAPALTRLGVRIEEEAVLDDLLQDLET